MPALRSIFGATVSVTLALSPVLQAQQFTDSANYESSKQAELEVRLAYAECRLEGRTAEQCRTPSLSNEDQQQIREMADEIDRRAAALYERFPELEETISGATQEFSRVIRECAAVTVNADGTTGDTCLEETFNDATTALGNAARTARQVCDALPNTNAESKVQCLTAVDEFSSSANQEIDKFLATMAPVLAFCAASAGTGCALMAIASLISLFLDSGGGSGDDGAETGETSGVQGEEGEPSSETPGPQPVAAADAFNGDGLWSVRDAQPAAIFSRDSPRATFSIAGFYGNANFVSVDPNPATNAIVAEVQEAGSIADFIARNAAENGVPTQKFTVVEVDQTGNNAASGNYAIRICAARDPAAGTGTGEPHIFLHFLQQRRNASGTWEHPIRAVGSCALITQ